MKEAAVQKKLIELNDFITHSHIHRVARAVGEEGVYVPERPSENTETEDSIRILELHVKYLMFDLEATRRENKYLRQLLESRRRPRRDDDSQSM